MFSTPQKAACLRAKLRRLLSATKLAGYDRRNGHSPHPARQRLQFAGRKWAQWPVKAQQSCIVRKMRFWQVFR